MSWAAGTLGRWAAAFPLIALSLASPCIAADPVAKTIMQLERDWSAAFLRHDARAIDRILADDFAGIDSRGVVSDKASELAEAAPRPAGSPAPDFEVLSESFSDMRVRVYGNTAVLTSTNDMRARFAGKDIAPKYRRTTVWVRRDGRWQCVSFHASRIVEQP